jgi:hypothetical protein
MDDSESKIINKKRAYAEITPTGTIASHAHSVIQAL